MRQVGREQELRRDARSTKYKILKSLLHVTYVFSIYIVNFRLRQFGSTFFSVLLPRFLLKSVSDAADGEEISEVCRCHIEVFLNAVEIEKN